MLKSNLLNYLNADKLTDTHQRHECLIIYKIYKMFVCTNPAPTFDSHNLPLHCGWQPGNQAIGTHNGGQMIENWTNGY
jgi:hypothetical protein